MSFLLGTTMTTVAQTAFDYYLDVAQYATIDEAIAQNNWTNSYLSHPYVFTRYNDEEVGWLSMTMYFAYMVSHHGTTGCMKWIDRNPTDAIHQTARGSGNVWSNTPSATNPCLGSSAYFDDAAYTTSYGTTNNTNTTKQSLAFYVTNITGLVIRGYSGKNSTDYPTEIEIYTCTENADGTLTARTTRSYYQKYTAQSQDISYVRLTGLDASTIYKIVCNRYRSRFLEIAFRTPIQTTPEITAEPATLNFETTVGTPVTQTFNVKGSDLEGDITATITNDNGNVFSVPATISQADASASDGTDVTVTFSPTQAGTYTGKLTLSSQGAIDVTIPLTGKANNYFPVNITSVGLTTLYLDSPLKIPYDEYEPNILGVYYIYGLNGKELLSARLDNTIPAKTGVIIQGNSGEYKFPIIEEADPLPSVAPNSLLSGCLEETPVSIVKDKNVGAKIYTLGRGKDTYINFYQYSGQMLHANKAFYLLEAAGNAKELSVRFDDQATGIRTASTLVDDGAWYTIQGIRLQGEPAAKGLYIHNGKTIVVK